MLTEVVEIFCSLWLLNISFCCWKRSIEISNSDYGSFFSFILFYVLNTIKYRWLNYFIFANLTLLLQWNLLAYVKECCLLPDLEGFQLFFVCFLRGLGLNIWLVCCCSGALFCFCCGIATPWFDWLVFSQYSSFLPFTEFCSIKLFN